MSLLPARMHFDPLPGLGRRKLPEPVDAAPSKFEAFETGDYTGRYDGPADGLATRAEVRTYRGWSFATTPCGDYPAFPPKPPLLIGEWDQPAARAEVRTYMKRLGQGLVTADEAEAFAPRLQLYQRQQELAKTGASGAAARQQGGLSMLMNATARQQRAFAAAFADAMKQVQADIETACGGI